MNSSVFNSKNKYVIIILAIILLIPAFLAFCFNGSIDKGSVMSTRISGISVAIPVSAQDIELSETSDFEFYTNAVQNAKLIDENYRDVSSETPFTVTITENDGVSSVYSFYIKNDTEGCIYTDADGKYHLISKKDAEALLKRTEYATVNTLASAPLAVHTKNGVDAEYLNATSGTWSYKDTNGEFTDKEIAQQGENPIVTVSLSNLGELRFNSEKQPDSVSVTLTKDGETKHEGAFENLLNAGVMSSSDTYYDMTVTAEWTKEKDSDCYGTLTYTAKLLYDVAPSYNIVYRGIVSKGDFTIIKIQNFNDADKLFAECAYSMPTELKVFRSPLGYSFAFLPAEYTYDMASGVFDLKLSLSDGSSQMLKLTVRDGRAPKLLNQDGFAGEESLTSAATAAALNEFDETVKTVTASSVASPLWSGKFVYPDGMGNIGTGMADFGTVRTVKGLETVSYIHKGLDIEVPAGTAVAAANNGKVVFASNLALTGNTVIIDHGCSVFSYYGNLDGISVSVGDSVSTYGTIGTAGSTGFAASFDGASYNQKSLVHFATSVDGVFVNPYYLCKSGVDFDDD